MNRREFLSAGAAGRSLTWDSQKELIVGDDEANKWLRRPYRKPWVHPEPKKA